MFSVVRQIYRLSFRATVSIPKTRAFCLPIGGLAGLELVCLAVQVLEDAIDAYFYDGIFTFHQAVFTFGAYGGAGLC